MTYSIKIRQIGNSYGVVLPKDILTKLRVNEGDDLHIVEASDGIKLQRFDPEFEKDLQLVDELMHSYKNALRELAK